MSTTIESPFHAAPRMSEAGFVAVLEQAGSFASDPLWSPTARDQRPAEAARIYRQIVATGHDPAVWLAICGHEHTFGTNPGSVLWRNNTRSWTNARTVRDPSLTNWQIITDDERGSEYVRYQSVADSVRDGLYRVDDPTYAYAGASTIGEVIAIWAPADDANDPHGYAQSVASDVTRWATQYPAEQETPPMAPNRPYHVAISYGHHNTDGGNATEREQTPKIGAAVAQACRDLGMEVRVVQDEVGLNPSMGLQDVAQVVVDWDRAGWPVDLYLETHTEGAGPDARGVFAIYPDTGDDVDHDAERVGRDAAQRIAQAVGIPLRGDGTMSERNTGVGAQGYRLGIFLVTAAINDHCTRMIIEYGSHDNQADLNAIMGNLPAVGQATAAAFGVEATRLGFTVGGDTAELGGGPEVIEFPETGHKLGHGFLRFWEKYGGLRIFGYPITEEFEENGLTVQYFERARFEWHPDNNDSDNWNVQLGLLGREVLESHDENAA